MVVCCGLVGRGACIQSLLVSVLLLVLVFPYLSSREFSGLAPQHTAKFKSAAILSLLVSMEMVQSIPTRARGLSMRTHLTAVRLLARSNDILFFNGFVNTID